MIAIQQYRQNHIMSANPMQLIVMLYDECIQSLEKAEDAFQHEGIDRIQTINNHLLHAQDILTELSVALDMERGGALAINLERIYEFMVHQLSNANLQKKVKPVQDVKTLLLELRDAWGKIAEQTASESNPDEKTAPGQLRAAG